MKIEAGKAYWYLQPDGGQHNVKCLVHFVTQQAGITVCLISSNKLISDCDGPQASYKAVPDYTLFDIAQ